MVIEVQALRGDRLMGMIFTQIRYYQPAGSGPLYWMWVCRPGWDWGVEI